MLEENAIPVRAIGEAYGVKTDGGTLAIVSQTINVRCLPKDLPEFIEIDVTELKVNESIHVGEVKAPKGITFPGDPKRVVIVCSEMAEEEAAPEATPAAGAAPAAGAEGAAAPAAGAAPASSTVTCQPRVASARAVPAPAMPEPITVTWRFGSVGRACGGVHGPVGCACSSASNSGASPTHKVRQTWPCSNRSR